MGSSNEHRVSVSLKIDSSSANLRFDPSAAATVNQVLAARAAAGGVGGIVGTGEADVGGVNTRIRQRFSDYGEARARLGKLTAADRRLGYNPRSYEFELYKIHAAYQSGDAFLGSQLTQELIDRRKIEQDIGAQDRVVSGLRAAATTRLGPVAKYNRLLARNPGLASAAGLASAISDLSTYGSADSYNREKFAEARERARSAAEVFRADLAANRPPTLKEKKQAELRYAEVMASVAGHQAFAASRGFPLHAAQASLLGDQAKAYKAEFDKNTPEGRDAAAAQWLEVTKTAKQLQDQQKETLREEARLEKEKKKGLESWLDKRGGALGFAMAARSVSGRLSQFGQSLATAEGDALAPMGMAGALKLGTGVGADIFTNRFIQSPTGGNMAGMIGFGLVDAIVGAFQAAVQRGINVRREGTALNSGQDMILGKSLVLDNMPGRIKADAYASWSASDQTVAEYSKTVASLRKQFGSSGSMGMALGLAEKGIGNPDWDSQERALNQEREWLRNVKMLGLLGVGGRWNWSVRNSDVFAAMQGMGDAGTSATLAAKAEYGGFYQKILSETGLAGDVAGIATNTGLNGKSAAMMSVLKALTGGTSGMGAATELGALTQRGLGYNSANSIAEAIFNARINGSGIDASGVSSYAGSLLGSGIAGGRIGRAITGGIDANMSARDLLLGGFKGAINGSTAIAALQQAGGNLFAAGDVASSMPLYNQTQAARRLLGDFVTQGGLMADRGLSSQDAAAMMGAGPSSPFGANISTILGSATNATRVNNMNEFMLMLTGKSVSEENRGAEIQNHLQAAAASLARAASAIGENGIM